ncbi:MAG: hypothetical protein RLZZ373_1338 [Pseudomonadota bacterium]|jgi:hypothetical protein
MAAIDANAGDHAHVILCVLTLAAFDMARSARCNWRISEWPHRCTLGTLCICLMCSISKPRTCAV